jgi:multiple sugar transport system permease protein
MTNPVGTINKGIFKPKKFKARSRDSLGYLFVSPAMIFFTVMAIFPTLYVLFLSFHTSPRGKPNQLEFAWFANYIEAFQTPILKEIVSHTLVFSIGSSILHLFFGFLFALFLNSQLNRRFLTFCRALLLAPWAISPAVVAMVWRLLAHPDISPIGQILKTINQGWHFAPLASTDSALFMLTAINTWHFTPFYMLLLLSGIQAINPELYEISKIDGANWFQRIRFITLPLIRRLVLTLLLFDVLTTAVYFDLVWITTRGGPAGATEVLATFTYRQAFLSFDFGFAAAISMILFAVSILLSFFLVSLMERNS